jgi:hypothetical protein
VEVENPGPQQHKTFMNDTPKQPSATPENKDISTRTRAARRIDVSIIEAVAALVSRGLTESEACRQLNIRPKTFFNFKSSRRNDERFAEILEKFRASRVEDLIEKIEKSASGDGLKMRDWRAAKFLLEVLDRERFNTDRPAVEVNTGPRIVNVALLEESIRRVYGSDAKPALPSAPVPPKQLENGKP